MTSLFETHERLRAKYASAPQPVIKEAASADPIEDCSFLVENPENSRLVISSPIREIAQAENPGLLLRGRLVGAEKANRNGAFWTSGDLEFGLPSVKYGPLNWVHKQEEVVGTLINPWLVTDEDMKWRNDSFRTDNDQPYIETNAVFWDWVRPEYSKILRDSLESGSAWMSMECMAEAVECGECGNITSWDVYLDGGPQVCVHVRERSAHRRMMNPTFYGAAIIVPPFEPGWSNAELTQVASNGRYMLAMESACAKSGVSEEQAASMVSAILQWSSR